MSLATCMQDGKQYQTRPRSAHEQTITVDGPGGAPMVEERRTCHCSIGHDHTDHDEWD